MADPILSMFQITVEFNPENINNPEQNPITILGPFNSENQLLVPQGISLIVFQVVTVNQGDGPEAQFPTYPIEWFVNNGGEFNTPIAQPESFKVHWLNPRQCTIVDTNTALFTNEHPFNVLVSYENNTYGTDPTIVNQPPIDG